MLFTTLLLGLVARLVMITVAIPVVLLDDVSIDDVGEEALTAETMPHVDPNAITVANTGADGKTKPVKSNEDYCRSAPTANDVFSYWSSGFGAGNLTNIENTGDLPNP